MEIAILMSTYNGHKFLDKQLKSIAEQTVIADSKLYIRDDGSSDDTFEIIERWKDKIDIVLFKRENVGPAKSFWELFCDDTIHADYYAFCDQDDIWDKNKIEIAIKYLKQGYDFYACNCRLIDSMDSCICDKRLPSAPDIKIQKLFISGCTQGCSMVFTNGLRQYIKGVGLERIPMHDIVTMIYAKYYGKIYWDSNVHFGYRVHSGNVVSKKNKSIKQKIKTTKWNWENSKKNSMTYLANRLLQSDLEISNYDKDFLRKISNYRYNKFWLIINTIKFHVDFSSTKSFIIRILFDLY